MADALYSCALLRVTVNQTVWPFMRGYSGLTYFFFFSNYMLITCSLSFHNIIPLCCINWPTSCVLLSFLWPHRSVPAGGPSGRSWHSFTPVSEDHVFLFGGFTTERETLSESEPREIEIEICPPKWTSPKGSVVVPRQGNALTMQPPGRRKHVLVLCWVFVSGPITALAAATPWHKGYHFWEAHVRPLRWTQVIIMGP